MMKRLSSSTSRLPFRNIAHSPETVPPPTVFLQLSATNLIAGSSTFEEFFGLLLINSVTDGPPSVHRRYSSYMFTAAGDSRVGGREQAEPPQAGDPPFWVERIGCPAQDDVLAQRNTDAGGTEGGADARVMKTAQFLSETFLPWEYLLVKCGCHSLSNSSYHRAPNCILFHTTQRVYVTCCVHSSMSEGTTGTENTLEPGCSL